MGPKSKFKSYNNPDTLKNTNQTPNDMRTFGVNSGINNTYHNVPGTPGKLEKSSGLRGFEGVSGTLKMGAVGKEVKQLQSLLKSRGYSIDVDGVFGEQTKSVLKQFQREYNKYMVAPGESKMLVDGILGRQTLGALQDKYIYQKPYSSKPSTSDWPQITPPDDVTFDTQSNWDALLAGLPLIPLLGMEALSASTTSTLPHVLNMVSKIKSPIPKNLPPRSMPSSPGRPNPSYPRTAPQNPGQPYGQFQFIDGGRLN